MANHPNRSRLFKSAAANPPAEEIRAARLKLGLTLKEAAAVVYRTERNWHQWEMRERRMEPAIWELFRVKTGLVELADILPPGPSA